MKPKTPLAKLIQAINLGFQIFGSHQAGNRKPIICSSSSDWCWFYRLFYWLYTRKTVKTIKKRRESKTMLLIDKYAYINRLKIFTQSRKLSFALFLLLFTLLVKDMMVSLITFIVMSALSIFAAKIPFCYYLKLLLLP